MSCKCTVCKRNSWVGTVGELREHLADDVGGCQYASMSCSVSCDKPRDQQVFEDLEEANECSSEDRQIVTFVNSVTFYHSVKKLLDNITLHALTFEWLALTPVTRK